MAQISIPMSNKVGYSMFWNSMWDRKINFSRFLNEDIYLNQFIPMLFDDNISLEILKTRNYNTINKDEITRLYNLHLKVLNLSKSNFYKYISEVSKVHIFKSKIWILKYQKWVIIYFFMYLPSFNNLKKRFIKTTIQKKYIYNNPLNLFRLYKKVNFKLKYSYNFYNKKVDKSYF